MMNSYIKYLLLPLSIIVCSTSNITNATGNYQYLKSCISKIQDYYSDYKMQDIVSKTELTASQIDYIKMWQKLHM